MMKKTRILALLLALALLLSACASSNNGETTAPTTTYPAAYGENDITAQDNYACSEADAADANMTAVVAVNALGEPALTNSLLQIYYWIEFYNFLNSYGNYAAYFGLDYTKPLADQSSMEEGLTWEQAFLKYAISRFEQDYALSQKAYAEGYTLSEEDEKQLADIADPEGEFAAEYTADGYESADDYLRQTFGDGVDVAAYQSYLRQYYAAYDYAMQLQTEMTDSEVSAYYDENAQTYQTNGLLKQNNVSARHILIQPEGEQDETTGEWTQQQWESANSQANDIYASWQENPTEENFIALVTEHSDDVDSVADGGLYENFGPTDMVAEFSAWCFDTARQAGDSAVVQTEYGYHILFFVGQTDGRAWYDQAANDLLTQKIDDLCAQEEYAVQVDYALVKIFDLVSASAQEESTQTTQEQPQG